MSGDEVPNQSGPLQKLKAYGRVGLFGSDGDWINTLNDESDRSCVIVGASLLEESLQLRIQRALPSWSRESEPRLQLFGQDGPFGGFSKKINVAFAMGFIAEETRSELHDIREMRNACAHNFRPLSFETPELIAMVKRLLLPGRAPLEVKEETAAAFKIVFKLELMILMAAIPLGSRQQAQAEFLKANNPASWEFPVKYVES